MAGLIAAHGRALGVAPQAKLLSVRVFVQQTYGSAVNYAPAISWAIDHGADIVCIAGGAYTDGAEQRDQIQRALDDDIIVVASTGNDSRTDVIKYPAAQDGVVAMGGTSRDGTVASVSNRGPGVILSAPAVDIVSTVRNKGYGSGTGTSAATAIVAGVAALVRSKYPDLSARDVVNRMTATATDKGPPGRDDAYGYGIVDPVAALTADIPPLPAGTGPSAEQSPPRRVWLTPALVGASVLVLATIAFLLLRRRRR